MPPIKCHLCLCLPNTFCSHAASHHHTRTSGFHGLWWSWPPDTFHWARRDSLKPLGFIFFPKPFHRVWHYAKYLYLKVFHCLWHHFRRIASAAFLNSTVSLCVPPDFCSSCVLDSCWVGHWFSPPFSSFVSPSHFLWLWGRADTKKVLVLIDHFITMFILCFVFIIQLSFVFLTCVSGISFCFKVLASRL